MSTPLPLLPRHGSPVVSIAPITLAAPGRARDLDLRVTAPIDGDDLPVVVLSHGHGPSNHISSLYGYGPVVNYWAAAGFVVITPTHLDSAMLGLRDADDPEAPLYWRSRVRDVSLLLDHLDEIEARFPAIRGRIDKRHIAIAGHSMGGFTASLLLGARAHDPRFDTAAEDLRDRRISAGVLLAAPGGPGSLNPVAAQQWPVFTTIDFSTMTTPTLVVRGDADASTHLTTAGPDWYLDPYHQAPGADALLTLAGGEHGLGGVAGYDAAETTDENPARVELVQRMTTAYLRTRLGLEPLAWESAYAELAADAQSPAHVSYSR